jgi:hypothetical protein
MYWDAAGVSTSHGGFVDPWKFCSSFELPIFHLMYTCGQNTQRYTSYGTWLKYYGQPNGMGSTQFSYVGELGRLEAKYPLSQSPADALIEYRGHYYQSLSCIYWTKWTQVFITTCHDDENGYLEETRDATFPYAVRAVAGLFYWFAEQTGMLDNCIGNATDVAGQTLTNNHLFPGNTIRAGKLDAAEGTAVVRTKGSVVEMRAAQEVILSDGFTARSASGGHVGYHPELEPEAFIARIYPCDKYNCEGTTAGLVRAPDAGDGTQPTDSKLVPPTATTPTAVRINLRKGGGPAMR